MVAACELCEDDPAEGDSSITDDDGVKHQFCHPVTDKGPRELSCFEVMCYTTVEDLPNGRRPPQVIRPLRQVKARQLLRQYGPPRWRA